MKAILRILPVGLLLLLWTGSLFPQSITSFSPVASSPGSTITITGTGFSATPVNNVVRFGTIRGTVTAAGPTSLSVTVPSGAPFATLSVAVLGSGKTAISSQRFNPKVQAGDFDNAAFSLDQTITANGWEPSLIDMNGDGKPDLLISRSVAYPTSPTIAYLQNTSSPGSLSFAAPVDVSVGSFEALRIVTGDMDSDGKMDFVLLGNNFTRVFRDIGTPGSPNLQLWQEIKNPDMTGGYWRTETSQKTNLFMLATGLLVDEDPFAITDTYPVSSSVWVPNYITQMSANDAVIQDFDGDGHPDIAIAYSGDYVNNVPGRVRIFVYRAQTFFQPEGYYLWWDTEIREQFGNRLDGYGLAAGDLDGDGRVDLAVAGHFLPFKGDGMVTFIMNTAAGMRLRSWDAPARTERILFADFDGDAKLDVAYQTKPDGAYNDTRTIVIARNTSVPDSINIQKTVEIQQTNAENAFQIADVDGDGRPDLVWPCDDASGFKAARNTGSPGTISFATSIDFLHSLEFQRAIAVGDLDGDGKPEIVSAESNTGNVSVLRNVIPSYSLSQSAVSIQSSAIAKSGATTVSLQVKDAQGAIMNTSGLSVSFSLTGSGTSVGTFGSTTYGGNGLYSATFTGTGVGTARSVSASIGGSPVSSALPTVTVNAGSYDVSQSRVSISRPIVASGATATAIFQARDANGDSLTTGGLAGVTFFLTGSGTSSGTFGTVADSGNGKYYAVFTGSTSGTANNLSARIGTDTVHTTLPSVTVNVGTFSTANSLTTLSVSPSLKYDTTTVTLQVKDSGGNNVTSGGLDVKFEFFGTPRSIVSTVGYILPVTDNQDGTYSAKVVCIGTGNKNIIASIYNSGTLSYQDVTSSPALTVNNRPLSLSLSTVSWDAGTSQLDSTRVQVSANPVFYLYVRNDKGESASTNLGINFFLGSDGTSSLSPLTSVSGSGGLYYAQWQATGVGTARSIYATIGSDTVTSTPRTIAVVPTPAHPNYPGYFETQVPVDTTFYWDAAGSATSYRVVLKADSLTGQTLIDSSGITSTQLAVSHLSHNRDYYWLVSSLYQSLEGQQNAERKFTTILAPPTIQYPYDGEKNIPLPAVLRWRSVSGAATYRLQVSADIDFQSLVSDQSGLTDTSVTIPGLIPGAKYYWRVNATGVGTSSFCDIRIFTTASTVISPTIYYVKPAGNDAADGSSWATAFATLQHALSVATAGNQIWVAAGTYKPTTTTDRSPYFDLKNGVAVYGGFAGTETNLSQRNWETNVSILSGDVDNDGTIANNSYHVVVGNTYATAVLDGFTVTGGNADGGQRGGGIYCSSGYPKLSNLIISNNSASDYGGGMYNILGNPTLVNVTFTSNTSGNRGGGLYTERGSPKLTDCVFQTNSAIDGGGISNGDYQYPNTSNPVFTNVIFKSNSSSHFGGGMYSEYGVPIFHNVVFYQNSSGSGGGLYNTNATITLANVTFNSNSASGGAGLYTWLSSVALKNVILWGNGTTQVYNGMSTVTLFNSLVQNGIPALGGYGISNNYGGADVDSGGNVFADPLFVNAGSENLQLSAGSPAIDAGTNDAVSLACDFNGNPRIVNGTADMGAFEYQDTSLSAASQAVTSNDSLYQFGPTKVELQFSRIAPERTVLIFANHYPTAPDSITFSGTPPGYTGSFRWVITKTGDPFSSATIVIDSVSTLPGMVNPSTMTIYKRDTAGVGVFIPLTTIYDASGDRLSATITSFSEFILAGTNTPLPVQISSFTGSANRLNAELKWRTSTEVDNFGFEVERRPVSSSGSQVSGFQLIATDAKLVTSWSKVGFVRGSGTSTSPKEYSYLDRSLPAGRYAYRIKQIDRNGAFRYTDAVEVEVGLAPRVFALSQNYPNPFNPSTTIEFTLPEDGRVKLRIYNMLGEEVATLVNEDRKAGIYQQEVFNASRLASGVYFSRLEFNGKQLIKKMLLIK